MSSPPKEKEKEVKHASIAGAGSTHAAPAEGSNEMDRRLRTIEEKLDKILAAQGAPKVPTPRGARKNSEPFSNSEPELPPSAAHPPQAQKKATFDDTVPQPPTGTRPPRATVLSPRMSITDGSPARRAAAASNKKEVAATKQKRHDFFDALVEQKHKWNEIPKMPGVKCVWLSCAVLAIRYVSGVDVSLGEMLRKTSAALHYFSFPSVTLAELYDMTAEFLEGDPRMKKDDVRVEIATFETDTVDDVEEMMGTGDRPPVQSLAAFRKEMFSELANQHSIYIFNYDPFVVQEAEAQMEEEMNEENDAEEEEEGEGEEGEKKKNKLAKAPQSPSQKQWQAKNQGTFSILTAYNPALHTVTLATPHLTPDGTYVLENHICPLQTLYEATLRKDGYTKRARGFVRVFCAAKEAEHVEHAIPSLFPVSVLDGRNAKGQISVALDVNIAPHLLGLGLLHHLAESQRAMELGAMSPTATPRRSSSLSRRKIELTGIRVSEICQVLHLPLSAICAPGTKESLPLACAWYQQYLARKNLTAYYEVGYVPITRRNDADDGALSLSEDSFFEYLTGAIHHKTLILIAFDVNIAQNLNLTTPEAAAHFAVVIGVDEHRGIVQLADVNVKKYRKVWHLPIMRLFNATVGYGFMTVSSASHGVEVMGAPPGTKEKDQGVSKTGEGKPRPRLELRRLSDSHGPHKTPVEEATSLLEAAKYRLPPPANIAHFEYPQKNYSITVLANALTRLGFPTRVEEILYGAGFHLSFLLSEHVPMMDAARILTYYSHSKLDDEVAVLATNFDTPDTLTVEAFRAVLKGVCASDEIQKTQIIVFYDASFVQRYPNVWNGSVGGNKAIVTAYEPTTDAVVLCDSNPDTFYRHWTCPVDFLYKACSAKDRIPDRARGFLRVSRQKSDAFHTTKVVDMRAAMTHHPFKPVISAPAACIALAFSELTGVPYSVEDVVYSSSSFDLLGLVGKSLDLTQCIDMANAFAKHEGIPATITKLSTAGCPKSEQLKEGLKNEKAFDVIVYDVKSVFGEAVASGSTGVGAGVVAHLENDTNVTIADGNPTRFGSTWKTTLSRLNQNGAVIGALRVALA